jgi:hypothetical protein
MKTPTHPRVGYNARKRCGTKLNDRSDQSPNLVVMLDQMEAFDTEVIQSLVYACR